MNIRIFIIGFSIFLALKTTTCKAQIIKDNDVENLIQKKRNYNAKHGYGFRIQLLSGYEKKVKETKTTFREEFPTVSTSIKYDKPWWKIQVGNYKSRLEADKALRVFQQKFPAAIVVTIK